MTAITILLLAAAVGFGLSRALNVPAVPLLILCGLGARLVAPLEGEFLEDALVLGLTVMVFVAGIELSPARVGRQRRPALIVGFSQMLLLGAAGFAAALFLDLSLEAAGYLALALSASSTLVVLRVLKSRGQLFEPFGRMLTGVLLLQDFLVILMIPVLDRLPGGGTEVLLGVAGTLALTGLSWVVLRWFAPFATQTLAFDDESLLLVVLSILFGFLGLAWWMDLPLVAGGFLAGVSLSGFPVHALVRGQLNSLSDFFNALFFTALGAFLVLPTGAEVLQALILLAVVVLLTPPLVAFLAERAGFSARPALLSGVLLAQTSEFSLVVGLQGVVTGQVSEGLFTVITLVTVASMILTPFLATDRLIWKLVKLHPARSRARDAEPPSDHILLLGCGQSGLSILELLMLGPDQPVAVDDDPTIIARLEEAGIRAFRGDITDLEVLEAAGARSARAIISTVRRVEDNRYILALTDRKTPTFVRTFDSDSARWVEQMGGQAVVYSDAGADDFIAWYQEEFAEGEAPEGDHRQEGEAAGA
ncbi:MAG: potassium transporter [Gemmatimonadales bacterium]|nr:MAG: potassium transporter [Gemmatimonadales bacterium]